MLGSFINRRMGCVAMACLVLGVTQGTALAGSHVSLPPDRADRIGSTPVQTHEVQLPPDRADGLGSARLPTMPTPVVMVRTVTDRSLDWWAVVGGIALGGAVVLITAAARLVQRQRVAAHGV